MELEAVGQADQHFIGNPEHSVFKKQFKQHQNHAIDWDVRSQFEGQGLTYRAEIPKKGDVCIGAMVDMGNNAAVPTSYRLLIGGQCIQEHAIHAGEARMQYLNDRETHHTTLLDYTHGFYQGKKVYYFLTDVFFSKKGCSMPLRCDQQLEVEIEFEEALSDEIYLQTFQIYLEDASSAREAQDIPITQMQETQHPAHTGDITVPLRFNLPIRSLQMSGGSHYTLKINGQTRFSMNEMQLHLISRYVDGAAEKDSSSYHFGIPNQEGHSGSFNMSKCDRVELIVKSDGSKPITVGVENYNLLRYQNGRYSLMYSD